MGINDNYTNHDGFFGSIVAWTALFAVVLGCWGCPHYTVWQQGMEGQAELERAKQNRQIRISEAEAEKESASLRADAEVERAKGVAKAVNEIGESLKNNEEYLRYLWINKLSENGQDVIYIPTEAGLPLLESQRLQLRKPEQTEQN